MLPCCYLRVLAQPPEVFLIAHHIQTRFTQPEVERVRQRLATHCATVRPLTPAQHFRTNVVCPLLHEGQCRVYSVRPFGCRYHHSLDFQACQFSYNHPEDVDYSGARHPTLLEQLDDARSSLCGAYKDLGFDMAPYELGSALADALDRQVAWRRWRDHKKPFVNVAGA